MPDATIFLNVVLSLGLLLSLGVSVLSLVRSGKTQKREVSFGTEHARKDEVFRVASEIQATKADIIKTRDDLSRDGHNRSAAVYAHIDKLRAEVKDDIKGVHDRINVVLQAVSRLEGEVKRNG